MYHDQGLIPFKSLSFGDGTNFTAGLNVIRTSPDHGVAYEIAGKNKANADSLKPIWKSMNPCTRNLPKSFDNLEQFLPVSSQPISFHHLELIAQ